MPGPFDATLKQLLDTCAPDWVGWLAPLVGLPASVGADPLDVDLSTVQPAADKVFRLRPPAAGLLHVEPQASRDADFPARLLLYNVLLDHRYGGPVHTVALLLRREALFQQLSGILTRDAADGREYLRFGYTVVRLWELPADALLAAGLGTAPLALLTDDAAPRLPELVDRFAERVEREAPGQGTADVLLTCGYILLGLRYDKEVIRTLFTGVQHMRESSTYQAILEEGWEKGVAAGELRVRRADLLDLLRQRFGTVSPEIEARIRAASDPARLGAAVRQVFTIGSPDELSL